MSQEMMEHGAVASPSTARESRSPLGAGDQDITALVGLALSELGCPFPAAEHPLARITQARSLCWLETFDFNASDSAYRHASSDDFSLLVSRWYANASEEDYQAISDFHVALYILDDVCDEHVIGKSPDALIRLHTRILELLHQSPLHPCDPPLARAFADVQKRMRARMSPFWINRLIADVQAYFEATLWEAKGRLEGTAPSTAEYQQMRMHSSAVPVYLDLIEFAEMFELPLQVRTYPQVRQIELQVNAIICWCNDIVSHWKERERGDVHNIIFSLQSEGQSLEDAIQTTVRLHNQQISLFQNACRTLPSLGQQEDEMLQRYIRGMQWMIRGNFDWSVSVTKRFGLVPSQFPPPYEAAKPYAAQ